MSACLPKLQRSSVKKRFLSRKKAGFGMTVVTRKYEGKKFHLNLSCFRINEIYYNFCILAEI